MLSHVSPGCVGHGPIHLLVKSVGIIHFHWNTDLDVWAEPGLPCLSNTFINC